MSAGGFDLRAFGLGAIGNSSYRQRFTTRRLHVRATAVNAYGTQMSGQSGEEYQVALAEAVGTGTSRDTREGVLVRI